MYLSHPVRHVRDDPTEGETVTLRVTTTDGPTADRVAAQIEEWGTVDERLRFAGLLVTVAQPRVADICALEGIDAIETENTLAIDTAGAGEDVVYEQASAGEEVDGSDSQ